MDHNKDQEFKSSTVEYGQHSPETNVYHTTTHEETNVKQPGKFKRNLRKYWWLHCLNFVIGTIVISMILYVYEFPHIYLRDMA